MLAETQHRIGLPVEAGDVRPGELNLLNKRAACRLDQHALDLVLDQRRIDRKARVQCTIEMLNPDFAALAVNLDVGYCAAVGADVRAERDAPSGPHPTRLGPPISDPRL